MKLLFFLLIPFLVACGPKNVDTSEFDKWYEQVINEPYDPLNGSKY
jgi:hypothetical protein